MAGLMYGLCMRLDSVLSRMEMVESIAVEVHSLLEFADCTVCSLQSGSCFLVAFLVLDNERVLLLLMGQEAKGPSIRVSVST